MRCGLATLRIITCWVRVHKVASISGLRATVSASQRLSFGLLGGLRATQETPQSGRLKSGFSNFRSTYQTPKLGSPASGVILATSQTLGWDRLMIIYLL